MAQYPLTQRQRELITSLVEGFKNRTIEDRWLVIQTRTGIEILHGMNNEDRELSDIWSTVSPADFPKFVQCGFMSTRDGRNYTLDEYTILEAIKNDFNKPDNPSINIYGNVNGGAIAIGGNQSLENASVSNASPAIQLPEAIQERIQQEAQRQNRPVAEIIADAIIRTFSTQ